MCRLFKDCVPVSRQFEAFKTALHYTDYLQKLDNLQRIYKSSRLQHLKQP